MFPGEFKPYCHVETFVRGYFNYEHYCYLKKRCYIIFCFVLFCFIKSFICIQTILRVFLYQNYSTTMLGILEVATVLTPWCESKCIS